MSEFKHFDGGELFLRPEKPVLLIYTDTDDVVSYAWLETEDDLLEIVEEVNLLSIISFKVSFLAFSLSIANCISDNQSFVAVHAP